MHLIKRYYVWIIEAIYLLFVFKVGQLPIRDFDIWFHMKSGELFLTQGKIVFTEVFSHAAAGRPWTPFEWLFQIIIYLVSTLGLWAIPPFIGLILVITHFILLRTFSFAFKVSLVPRLLLSLAFLISTYEFNTARPHTLAYACLAGLFFLIFARIFKKKKWIYYSPLLLLFWANIHSSGFLAWGFLLAFTIVMGIQYLINRQEDTLRIVKEFGILALISFIVTLLPPLGLLDYKLLWHFFTEREFLGVFISEWGSPTDNPFGFRVYTATVIISLGLFVITAWRKKVFKKNLWALPLIAAAFFGYTATRNVYIGTLGIIYLLGWTIPRIQILPELKRARTLLAVGLIIALLGFYGWIFAQKSYNIHNDRLYYPVDSTEFIKRYMKGKMFNDYNYGGYILYHIYPKQVFIDGRADVYLCCEMHDYLALSVNKRLSDKEYKSFLDELWRKYKIDYAIIGTQKHNVFRKMATILNNDPGWSLVFWDDSSQVFVKRNGVNDEVIEKLEARYATPYLRNPYRDGHRLDALDEYERADSIAKSARTSNAIGYIKGQDGDFATAQKRFEEAMQIDPTFESPYMNLAELAARSGDLPAAIQLYREAGSRAPDRGLIYIRLGQLTLQYSGNKDEVRQIWQNGITNTVDADAKKQLSQLLSQL